VPDYVRFYAGALEAPASQAPAEDSGPDE
jgi:hypothetical protein